MGKLRVVVVIALVFVGAALYAGSADAKGPKPVISGLAVSAPSPGGGTTVTASVSGATECTLSTNKEVNGLPVSFSCASGTVERLVTLPPGATLKPTTYALTLVARAPSPFSKATTKVTVRPEPLSLATGYATACAVLAGGHIACWGEGEYGQLGNGKNKNEDAPVEVKGIADATQVSPGEVSCALLSTGHVDCWGKARKGDLGHGEGDGEPETCGFNKPRIYQTCSKKPVEVQAIGDATQVSASAEGNTACALLATGHIDCWGSNESGQLGAGTSEEGRSTPIEVQGVSEAVQVSAGGESACALLASGHVECWGSDRWGQLGDGTIEAGRDTPIEVQGISSATEISVGGSFACALLASGHLECWGQNTSGQLGAGTSEEDDDLPIELEGISDATSVSAGEWHACAARAGGQLGCWGGNDYGDLGLGTDEGPETCQNVCSRSPVEPVGVAGAVQVGASQFNGCALLSGGTIDCWGADWYGQLGIGVVMQSPPKSWGPAEVLGL